MLLPGSDLRMPMAIPVRTTFISLVGPWEPDSAPATSTADKPTV